jgi:RND family efflux transporter MFP subunit
MTEEITRAGPSQRGSSKVYAACGAAVVVAAVGVVALFAKKETAEAREGRTRASQVEKGPLVRTALVEVAPGSKVLTLTGEVRAYDQATLYGKVSGYVKRMAVDKGERVRKGQVLAALESPDADEQVFAAQADLILKQQQERRTRALAPTHTVSEQDLDQAESALKLAESALARAKVLQSYATLRAPFDGVVTARFVDPGALVAAATGSTTSVQPVLELAAMDRLRVWIYLPQDDALAVREGDEALLAPREGSPIHATVTRVTHSLDPRTRTMLAEIVVPNVPARMVPGQFVTVQLHVPRPPRPLVLADALVIRGKSASVALVEKDRVRLVPVVMGDSDGKKVEVLEGLQGGERVALNAGALPDGSPVQAIDVAAGPR